MEILLYPLAIVGGAFLLIVLIVGFCTLEEALRKGSENDS